MTRCCYFKITPALALLTASAVATTTLEPLQDTDVYQFTGTPTSTAFSLNVTPPAGHGLKSALQFEVTPAAVGFGAQELQSATLRLYVLEPLGDRESFTAGTIDIYYVQQAWTETGARWGTLTNGALAASFSVTAHSHSGSAVFVEVDITAAVRAWLEGSQVNHGLILQSRTDGSGASTAFAARDDPSVAWDNPIDPAAVPPQLIVERTQDQDADGYSDADELAWGSDPQNAQSIPVRVTLHNGEVLFNTWPERQYQVQTSSDLARWDDLGAPMAGNGEEARRELPTGTSSAGAYFVRVADVSNP